MAQWSGSASNIIDGSGDPDGSTTAASIKSASVSYAPFSRYAIGGVVSPLGPGVQVTAYVNRHLNLRAVGNGFSYNTNFSTNGFNANAKLNLASAGISGDIYPFRSGFRISPGVLFVNNNKLTATSTVAGGTSFTLNGDTFYSANANTTTGATPLNADASLNLHTTRPSFTITAGWGNTIPRKGGHWSFPFEIGAAFIGSPTLNANLTGWACADQAQTECTDVASTTDPIALQIQGDLTAQLAKWNSDLNPLKEYPILSFGVAYSFGAPGAH